MYEAELQDKVQNFIKDDILTNEKMCPNSKVPPVS